MALFEVPGWSVPSAAPMAPSSSSSHSKKRKRPTGDKHQDADKISTAAANVEQLIAKLGSGADGEKETPKNKKQKTKAKANPKAQEPKTSVQKKERSTSKQQQTKSTKHSVQEPSDETSPSLSSSPKGKGKQSKPRDKRKDAGAPSKATVADTEASPDTHSSLTALQSKMKNSLEGARFRWVYVAFSLVPLAISNHGLKLLTKKTLQMSLQTLVLGGLMRRYTSLTANMPMR